MPGRRLGSALVAAIGLGIVGLAVGGSSTPAVQRLRIQPIVATTNHAAVVIDTGQEVKKFCLAFPEDEITGAEALRRVDAQAVFANFGTRGQAVCSLCGTGCPSSNCFCDPNRFWAYHRAGPGGAPYAFSRTGASGATVRNGDVEGWKWGGGEAPPPAKVSEVCNVDEPPSRTSSAAPTTSTTTTQPGQEPPGTTSTTGAPTSAASPATTTLTPSSTTAIVPGGSRRGPLAGAEPPSSSTTVAPSEPELVVPNGEIGEASGLDVADAAEAEEEEAAAPLDDGAPTSSASRGTLAVFVALLGGILVWRARLKRSKVRRAGPVR